MPKQHHPAVAVIMSVYKSDMLDNFRDAIESILKQDYPNITVFLFCDGPLQSEVNNYIMDLSVRYNINVTYSKKNIGLASGLNSLIDAVLSNAEYEFIARMDSDDISRISRLSKQIEFMITHEDVDVSGTSCREFGADFCLEEKHLPVKHSDLLNFSIARCPFIHPTVMFRRRVFETGIRYPVSTQLTEDMALWFNLLSQGFKFSNLNEILLDYRVNSAMLKRRNGFRKALSEITIRMKYMVRLRRVNITNIMLISARLFFHLMPPTLMSLAYKKFRNIKR
ncbi:TPA: glycosyltransferase [Escherichia coli]